jgi:serine/threonine protein phosphatase 1
MKVGVVAAILDRLKRKPRVSSHGSPAPESSLDADLPDHLRIYAIGDVHGCAELLADLHAQIDRREADRPPGRVIEILIGDIVDRGPDSRKVIDMLLKRSKRHVVVVLRGNHEQIMLDALDDPGQLPRWLRLGGLDTLRSYGVTPAAPFEGDNLIETVKRAREAIPKAHIEFLEQLPIIFRCRKLTFVHAGVRPGVPVDQQDYGDLMTIREPFLSYEGDLGAYVIHGHTPTHQVDIRPNRMNIDTGAYATGRLSGVFIEQGRFEIFDTLASGVSP